MGVLHPFYNMKPSKFLISASICAALTVLSFSAHAKDPVGYENTPVQFRSHPDFTPPQIIKGSFIVRPILETKGWYDSNVFLDKHNEVSDFAFSAKPSLELQSDFARHALSFKFSADYISYTDESDQNTLDLSLLANGRADITHDLSATASIYVAKDHEDRTDATTPSSPLKPTEMTSQLASLSFDYTPSKFKLSLFGSYGINKFENGISRDQTTRLIEEDRNADIITGGARVSYKYNENLEPFINASVTDYRYHHKRYNAATGDFTGIDQDKTLYSVGPGIAFSYKNLISGSIQGGFGYEDSVDPSTDSKKTYLIDASATWNPTKLTTVTGQLNRSFDTDSSTNAGTVETTGNINVYHELKRNFILGAGTEVKYRDFDSSARLDKIYSLNLNGEYKINDHFSVTGGYIMNRRLSEYTDFDYNQNLFYLGLNHQF
jgi:hypothetical protein